MAATLVIPKDPLDSPLWEATVANYLSDHPIVFDDAVVVGLPPITEDQQQVPVMVDTSRLGTVDEVVLIADLSPFPMTVKVRPKQSPAVFALRMRIEQGTAIRAAALKDGQWRVGARYLDAAGGGCSAPPEVAARIDWDNIGQMRARMWREARDQMRMRLRITHPMDTGLHKEPAYYIQQVAFEDADGRLLADMEVHQPVAANPVFTMQFAAPEQGDHVAVTARDNDGGIFRAKVPMVRTAAAATFREGRL